MFGNEAVNEAVNKGVSEAVDETFNEAVDNSINVSENVTSKTAVKNLIGICFCTELEPISKPDNYFFNHCCRFASLVRNGPLTFKSFFFCLFSRLFPNVSNVKNEITLIIFVLFI